MLENKFSFLIKKIVNSDEEAEFLEASNAIEFLVGHLDSIFLYNFFETKLNAREKHRFFKIFSDAEETSIYTGNSLQFIHYKKMFKSKHFFVFKRAFKKTVFLYLAPLMLLGSCGFFSYGFLSNLILILLISLISIFLYIKRRLYISIRQNEIIIKEIRKEDLNKNISKTESFLINSGWLIQD